MNTQFNEYQEAIDQAIKAIEPKREALYRAAVERRDQLAADTSTDTQRAALVAIIDQAISHADAETIHNAPIIMGQFVAAQIQHPGALSGKGSIVLEVFIDAAKTLDTATRRQVLEAVLLVATGAANGGLYHWLATWHGGLSLDTLSRFCQIIDKTAYDLHADTLAQHQADHTIASRYADKFKAPVIITPATKEEQHEEPELITVRNHNEGTPLKIAGVKFPGHGATTRITPQEFEQVKQSPIWQSGVSVNALEVVQ